MDTEKPWYESGTFWTSLGGAVTALGGLIGAFVTKDPKEAWIAVLAIWHFWTAWRQRKGQGVGITAVFAGIFLGVLLLASGPRPAYAAVPTGYAVPYEIGASSSTNFFNVFTGPGVLIDIRPSSGTTGDFTVCFDSGNVAGLTLSGDGVGTSPRIAAVFVGSTPFNTSMVGAQPVGVSNGLSCANSGAKHTVILYKSGVNP